jgi:hypothetical protein
MVKVADQKTGRTNGHMRDTNELLAHLVVTATRWDTPCIRKDHQLRKEVIQSINTVFY